MGRDNSIHIRFALKGFAHIPAIILFRQMRIHRRRPKGLCLLILILLYRTRIRRRSAPPYACSLLLSKQYAIGRQFGYNICEKIYETQDDNQIGFGLDCAKEKFYFYI